MNLLLRLLLLMTSLLLMPMNCQLSHDYGLEDACQQMGGTFNKRKDRNSIEGDKCDLKFKVATHDDEDAREFCELYAPWRLNGVKREEIAGRFYTTCQVEATLMCEKGWTQMFGHCFKMPKKWSKFTLQEAKDLCKKENPKGEIAFMHHRYIVGIWKRFYRGPDQIWVTATESWDQYVQKTNTVDGDALALAFFGKHPQFAVPFNSLIRIDPNMRMQVLCQYKPQITNAEINYLGKRYSEIYFPSVSVDHGILVRSASSYTSKADLMEVCNATLRPYMTNVVGPFVPDQQAMAQISQTKLPFVTLTRSGAEARLYEDKMKDTATCQYVTNRFLVKVPGITVGDYHVDDFEGEIECDNMKSAGIFHSAKKAELRVMSESRSVPIWCKLGRIPKFTFDSSPGYTAFTRENGDIVEHKLYNMKMNYAEASAKCKEDGALLSGIDSLKESHVLGKLAKEVKCVGCSLWLGGRRKTECLDTTGYEEGTTDKCARNNVIAWQDGVATTFYDDWWRDGSDHHKNPSSRKNQPQPCLVYVEGKPTWADDDTTRFLDDLECNFKLDFFCMKKIEIKKEEEEWKD